MNDSAVPGITCECWRESVGRGFVTRGSSSAFIDSKHAVGYIFFACFDTLSFVLGSSSFYCTKYISGRNVK